MKKKNTTPNKQHYLVMTGLILITMLLLNSSLVFADTGIRENQAASRVFTLEDFGLLADDSYQGVLVSRDYGINLPAAWEYGSPAAFALKFSHSPTLNEKSSLSVDWNGVRIGSQALTAANAENGSLTLEIPAGNLTQGYNTLHVEFYMGISDDFCSDVDNPAVWAVVHKDSALTLAPLAASPRADLSVFPLPFVDSSPVVENRVTIIVPARAGSGELNALAAISAKLGEITGGWRPLDVQVISAEMAAQTAPQGNLIVVATFDGLKKISSTLAPAKGQSGSGVLYEQVSPFDASALLLAVTGETQAEVEKAGRALTGDSLYARLAGDSAFILDLPEQQASPEIAGTTLTLEQLGYASAAVYGSRDQQVSYSMPLKALWQSNSSAVLELHFLHSALSAGERFTLTVAINNLPVGSVVINGGATGDRHDSFQLPLSFFKTGLNYLTIQSSIQLSDDFNSGSDYCTDEHFNEAWLTIANDSQITFPSSPDQVTTNIANFPYTFLGSSDLSQLAFVLPDEAGLADAQVLAALAVRAGQIAGGDALWPRVLGASALEDSGEDYPYRILIGLPLKNSAILEAASQLPQPFDPTSGQALPVSGLAVVDTSRIDTGYIEAFIGASGAPQLVVSGNSEAGMLSAAAHLSDAGKSILLEGDLAITTSDTLAASLWVEEGTEETATLSTAVQTRQALTVWFQPNGVLYAALVILLVTLVILVMHVIATFGKKDTDR